MKYCNTKAHNLNTSCILPIYFRQLNQIVFYDLIFFPAFCFLWWHCITLTRFLRINILPQWRLFQPKQHKAKRRNKVVTVHLHHVISQTFIYRNKFYIGLRQVVLFSLVFGLKTNSHYFLNIC